MPHTIIYWQYLFGAVIMVALSCFLALLYSRKVKIKELFSKRSMVFMGAKKCGKGELIKCLAHNKVHIHPFMDWLRLASASFRDREVQLVEIPYTVAEGEARKEIEIMKKLNFDVLVYIFDVSKDADSIKQQVKWFEKIKSIFKDKKFLIVANKIDYVDGKKLKYLKSRFKSVYTISALEGNGVFRLRKAILNKRLKIV